LEERISTGYYPLGTRLPPVRNIAAEFGTSPSTVSRALQEMMRAGFLEVFNRRFVRVRDQLPVKAARTADIQQSVKAIAHKWKLRGGAQDELMETFRAVASEVFKDQARFVFTECTVHDLNFMAEQVSMQLPNVPLARILIKDLAKYELGQDSPIVLVPYYHYAEVQAVVGDRAPVVPLHFTPSVETLDKLVTTVKPKSKVVVFGLNKRSVERLSLMVRHYVDTRITTVTVAERHKLARLIRSADAVVAVTAAVDTAPELRQTENLIEVRFSLDTSLKNKIDKSSFNLITQDAR
jgi:DNA-binding transcriptional regulator YhcF (GntR family)